MPKIAISTTSFGEYDNLPLELCKKQGYQIIKNPYNRKVKPDELVDFAAGSIGLIAGTESITAEMLSRLKELRVISRCGAGLENVDMDAAKKIGIRVFNTPDAPTIAVAELTIGLILNLLRKVRQMDASVRQGKWEKMMGNLLGKKKVGIIGFGRIGRKVAELLKPFGCDIAFFDPNVKNAPLGSAAMSKNALLKWADIITIHAAAKDIIIGKMEFALVKKGSWLVNTGRGEALDEDALYRLLKEGHLAGAAVDVFRQEPYNGPLKDLDNVILTPHIGSYAKEARIKMEMEAVNNLLKGLSEEGGD